MTEDPSIRVEARALSLGYGGRIVLRDVNVCLRAGEFWFLLGNNGHGKSTLVHALLGLLRPIGGELRMHPELRDRSRVGFVPQRCEISPALPTTVREFIRLGLTGLSLDAGEIRRRCLEAAELVGLAGRLTESYWHLSGGLRQRALLARALARRPALLLLDEPTNALDPTGESDLLDALVELNRSRRITMVLVTHDLAMAARFASHVALFRDGTIAAGPREDRLTPSELRATFGAEVAGAFS